MDSVQSGALDEGSANAARPRDDAALYPGCETGAGVAVKGERGKRRFRRRFRLAGRLIGAAAAFKGGVMGRVGCLSDPPGHAEFARDRLAAGKIRGDAKISPHLHDMAFFPTVFQKRSRRVEIPGQGAQFDACEAPQFQKPLAAFHLAYPVSSAFV